jgi:tRNA-splicing endonuclease subunit Sen34
MDLVGGGRLGTGVKKGFLLGGVEDRDGGDKEDGDVRTFCVEWGGM